jgi:hypothetical protein
MALKNDLSSILKTADVQKDLDNAKRYISVVPDDNSITLYHGSPTKGIKDLDINMAGKNTMSGEKAIYFTDDFPTAETFSYERNPSNSMFVNNKGKKGEVYTRNVNTNNFLDLDNLTDDQIVDLYNYIDPRSAGLMDKNKFVQTLNDARAAGNSQMIKAQLDLNKLADDYDGFIAKMYPGENDVREYGVFNPQNIITPDVEQYLPKKLAISGDDVAQGIQDKFGKSVAVDEKGNLLDLYHGTDADFDKFGEIKTEPGYWFTEDKDYAQSHGKNLMTVNLDMKNPIDMTTAEGEDLLYNLARERFGLKDFVPEDKIFSKEFREFLQSRGYDGLIWDKDGKNTYVAFRPEQIKMRNKKLTK